MANFIVKYFRESYEELKKVSWPSRKDTLRDTLVVIGVSVVVALFLGVIDFGLSEALQTFIAR